MRVQVKKEDGGRLSARWILTSAPPAKTLPRGGAPTPTSCASCWSGRRGSEWSERDIASHKIKSSNLLVPCHVCGKTTAYGTVMP